MNKKGLVPVSLLTGYLGAGKQHCLTMCFQTKRATELPLS